VQTHEVSSGKRPVGKMTQFSFSPNSAKLTSVVRQSGKSRMTILDFTEQNHVVLDFSGNVLVQPFDVRQPFASKLVMLFGCTVRFLVASGQTFELLEMRSFRPWTRMKCLWLTKDMSMEMDVLSLLIYLVVYGGIKCLL
jgi:hypothetical protein